MGAVKARMVTLRFVATTMIQEQVAVYWDRARECLALCGMLYPFTCALNLAIFFAHCAPKTSYAYYGLENPLGLSYSLCLNVLQGTHMR